MTLVLMAAIVFAAIFVVGYPLVNAERYRYAENGGDSDEPWAGLISARNSIYDAIRDLEFDRATGKLSEQDYAPMRARYDAQAAAVLQKMDALSGQKSEARAGKARPPRAQAVRVKCPACGGRIEANDRFCARCGARLN